MKKLSTYLRIFFIVSFVLGSFLLSSLIAKAACQGIEYGCVSGQCEIIDSSSCYPSTCASDADCVLGGGGSVYNKHTTCSSGLCIQVPGSGSNECSPIFAACGVPTPTPTPSSACTLTAVPSNGDSPLTVTLTISEPARPPAHDRHQIDFGDGTSSSITAPHNPSVLHTYTFNESSLYGPVFTATGKLIDTIRGGGVVGTCTTTIIVSFNPSPTPTPVITPTPGPSAPTVSNVQISQPNYCTSGPAATVTWDYFDPNGDPQKAFQVQIDAEGSSFQNSPVDCTCNGTWGGLACPYSGSCDASATSFYTGTGILVFNKTYKARVRVSDSAVLAGDFLKHDFASVNESLLANLLKSFGNLFR